MSKQTFKQQLEALMKNKDIHAPMITQGIRGFMITTSNGTKILTNEGTVEHMRKQQEREAERAFMALTSEPVHVPPAPEHVRAVYEQHQEDVMLFVNLTNKWQGKEGR